MLPTRDTDTLMCCRSSASWTWLAAGQATRTTGKDCCGQECWCNTLAGSLVLDYSRICCHCYSWSASTWEHAGDPSVLSNHHSGPTCVSCHREADQAAQHCAAIVHRHPRQRGQRGTQRRSQLLYARPNAVDAQPHALLGCDAKPDLHSTLEGGTPASANSQCCAMLLAPEQSMG